MPGFDTILAYIGQSVASKAPSILSRLPADPNAAQAYIDYWTARGLLNSSTFSIKDGATVRNLYNPPMPTLDEWTAKSFTYWDNINFQLKSNPSVSFQATGTTVTPSGVMSSVNTLSYSNSTIIIIVGIFIIIIIFIKSLFHGSRARMVSKKLY